jgi:hypothetical protein
MDFEEEEDENDAEILVLDPVDIGIVELPGVDIAGQALQMLRLMILAIIKKICGVLVDILIQIAPNVYKSCVMTDKG